MYQQIIRNLAFKRVGRPVLTDWHPRSALGGPPPAGLCAGVRADGSSRLRIRPQGGEGYAWRRQRPLLPVPPRPDPSERNRDGPSDPDVLPTEVVDRRPGNPPRVVPRAPSPSAPVERVFSRPHKSDRGYPASASPQPPIPAKTVVREPPSRADVDMLRARKRLRSSRCIAFIGGLSRWGAPPRRAFPGSRPARPAPSGAVSLRFGGYLVDPASSICLSQRLSHASLSTHGRYSETANGSLNQLWFLWTFTCYLDNCGNSRANTCKRALTSGDACIYQTQNPCGVPFGVPRPLW